MEKQEKTKYKLAAAMTDGPGRKRSDQYMPGRYSKIRNDT